MDSSIGDFLAEVCLNVVPRSFMYRLARRSFTKRDENVRKQQCVLAEWAFGVSTKVDQSKTWRFPKGFCGAQVDI